MHKLYQVGDVIQTTHGICTISSQSYPLDTNEALYGVRDFNGTPRAFIYYIFANCIKYKLSKNEVLALGIIES